MRQSDRVSKRLAGFMSSIEQHYPLFVGFPAATDFDYEELFPLFRYLINNVGDPFVEPLHALHSAGMEQEVVAFFAELFRAPKDDYWGYVTSGGSEGNLYALYVARELLPEAPVFYSKAAHYSIPKNVSILRQKACAVAALPSGEMDYKDLARQLAGRRGKSAIVVATVGTTMSEAQDNVARIRSAAVKAGVSRVYIHADAALAGVYTALLEPHHPFDFADGADSVSISGHKFIGSPMPCGVVVVSRQAREAVRRSATYVGSPDTTIGGSRNGHTPIILWYAIRRWGREGFKTRAIRCLEVADYTHAELRRIGWKSWRNPRAITVMIASPPARLIRKWQLATYGGWSHVICMPGVTRERIDSFTSDLVAARRPEPLTQPAP